MGQIFSKLASAIQNDIIAGLRGYHTNLSMSMELLEDDIVDMRMLLIKEYTLKGIIPINDLVLAINCIEIDCKDLDKCSVCRGNSTCTKPVAHFEIPQLLLGYGLNPILYLGSTDRQNPFVYYISSHAFNYYRLFRRRGKNKPYVYIDIAPNENGMLDCYLFNAPLMKQISIVAVFKDPRQLEQYKCCSDLGDDNFSFLNSEIKRRLTDLKIKYYRQLAPPNLPNDLAYQPG